MRTKAEIVIEDYQGKFNCAQSVLAVFCEDYGLDEKTALRMAAAFGGGCHFGGTCGAILGATAVIGLKYGNDVQDMDKYNYNRERVREFMTTFKEKFGSVACSELLGIDMEDAGGRDKARGLGLFETQCAEYIRSSAEILEDMGF